MRRIRFRIANLLVLVLFLAVGLAALRAATEPWDKALFGGTFVLLLVSVLLAVHRPGRARAFWLGFALFGWAYLVASLVPSVEARLPTTRALAYLDAKVPGRDYAGRELLWDTLTGNVLGGSGAASPEHFLRIGHALLALAMGCAGGGLSRALAAGDRQSEADR
jgi:hypothetical protein